MSDNMERSYQNVIADLKQKLAAAEADNARLSEIVTGFTQANERWLHEIRAERDLFRTKLAVAEARIAEQDAQLRRGAAHAQERIGLVNDLATAHELLKEACIGYEHNPVDASSDQRLRLVPIFHAWYERAKKECGE